MEAVEVLVMGMVVLLELYCALIYNNSMVATQAAMRSPCGERQSRLAPQADRISATRKHVPFTGDDPSPCMTKRFPFTGNTSSHANI